MNIIGINNMLIVIFSCLLLFQNSGPDSFAQENNYEQEVLKTIPDNIEPVFGYRFVIKGDFNGDGTKETLTEHFCSAQDRKETNKFYEGLTDYDQLVVLNARKRPYSFVLSGNEAIDTLHISSMEQQIGLLFLKNEGDLNGDSTDEVSYVINYADWSNLNTRHIMTYKGNKWQELYSFPIWEWQLPELPRMTGRPELFSIEDNSSSSENPEQNDFEGLVKKLDGNRIRVIFRNDEAMEDTTIVDLNP